MMKNNFNHGMSNGGDFDLPQDLLQLLPSDPNEQLDVARRITAFAISGRVAKLEAEAGKLRQMVEEKEHVIYDLQKRVVDIEQSLQETTARLSHSLDEQAKLANEKNVLLATAKRLNRDVARLETFKRTLMQSLREDEEISPQLESAEKLAAYKASSLETPFKSLHVSGGDHSIHRAHIVEDNGNNALSVRSSHVGRSASMPVDTVISSSTQDDEGHAVSDAPKYMSQSQRSLSVTPHHLTPPTGSPKKRSAAGSPRQQLSAPDSPKPHSTNHFKVSLPSSQAVTAPNSPPPAAGSLPTRTPKVDGKEFFRKARNRLSYEQFSAFLANIKELNAHRQTREETLKKADEIFGPENKDLYASFDGLLSRHLPS